MNKSKHCPTCITLHILEKALEAMPTASGAYLEFLITTANKCMAILDSQPAGGAYEHLNPR